MSEVKKRKIAKQIKTKETSGSNRRSEEFAGISNKGATCYLNALLQTLYMSDEVKKAVFRLKEEIKAKRKKSIAYQLGVLFEELDAKRTGNTEKITEVLDIDVNKQQDVAEHFRQILNKLAEESGEPCAILQIYQINLINLLTCLECETKIPENCSILVIPLPVHLNDCGNSIQSVNAGLQDFFKTVILDGDNLCYCDKCQKKTKATMRYCCESLPQILVLQLKRLEFDYSMKSFKKLHNKVKIPECLKFQKNEKVSETEWIPYSMKSEESAEAPGKQQPSLLGSKRSKENKVEEKQKSQLDGSQRIFTTYKLFAICDHDGEFGFGHYVAHIRPDTSDKWYRFNDTCVSQVENFFPEVCKDNTESMPCRRSSTAYFLMYKKENMNSNQDVIMQMREPKESREYMMEEATIKQKQKSEGNRQSVKNKNNQMEELPTNQHNKRNCMCSCFSGYNDD